MHQAGHLWVGLCGSCCCAVDLDAKARRFFGGAAPDTGAPAMDPTAAALPEGRGAIGLHTRVSTAKRSMQAMGGARAIIATVTSAKAMQAVSGGLGVNGTMMVIGAVGALAVDSLDLLGKRASVRGWYSGTAADSEDTLAFSQLNAIASMNEIFPLEEAQAAYDRMMSGKARFRVVLKIGS
jgi:D-arabinose 1-dehydrogenase-like Zn-dependent alcohol dehydrogenase